MGANGVQRYCSHMASVKVQKDSLRSVAIYLTEISIKVHLLRKVSIVHFLAGHGVRHDSRLASLDLFVEVPNFVSRPWSQQRSSPHSSRQE